MRDTIDMARAIWESGTGIYEGPNIGQLKAFEALVRADERSVEREECAKVCDVLAADYGKAGLPMTFHALSATATKIRARGETQ